MPVLPPHEELLRELVAELSVSSPDPRFDRGNRAVVEALADYAESIGFRCEVKELANDPRKANLVAVLGEGEGGLLLAGHTDTVPYDDGAWSTEPLELTNVDGRLHGLGAAYMKGFFPAALHAIASIDRHRLRAPIVLVATADEESGPFNGVDWLLKNHREKMDAEWVINEGGGGTHRNGKPLFNTVQAAEKVTTNFTLQVTNKGGHSSVPRDDNAITQLADALAKVGRYAFPVHLNDVTRAFFSGSAAEEEPSLGRAMRAIVANPSDASALRVLSADPRYNAMLRTTCVATELKGGHATNALPQLAEANINCRIYPTETAAQVRDSLQRVIGDTGVKVLIRSQRPPSPPTTLANEVMEPIRRITKEMWGDIPVIPTMSTGATDSRFFRTLGVPAYGVSGLFSDPAVDARAHGRDERMRVQSFFEGHEFLYRLTRALAGPRRPVSN